jgi:NTP pyrophosphatase (non-canonical NTP hydrolase)
MDEELADLLYLTLKMANQSGVNLEEAFRNKMEKNTKRFPIDK